MDADAFRYIANCPARIAHETNGLVLIFLSEVSACHQNSSSACSQRRPLADCLQDRKRSTHAYLARRRAEGKADREIRRSIKRYITRQLYRTLTTAMNPEYHS